VVARKAKFPHRAILVVWDDAEVSNDWQETPKEEELEQGTVYTLGFLVRETEKYLLIASTYDGNITNARTKIPKGMIVERREVKL
jgi:heme-degrading monooxygenase HmoA